MQFSNRMTWYLGLGLDIATSKFNYSPSVFFDFKNLSILLHILPPVTPGFCFKPAFRLLFSFTASNGKYIAVTETVAARNKTPTIMKAFCFLLPLEEEKEEQEIFVRFNCDLCTDLKSFKWSIIEGPQSLCRQKSVVYHSPKYSACPRIVGMEVSNNSHVKLPLLSEAYREVSVESFLFRIWQLTFFFVKYSCRNLRLN